MSKRGIYTIITTFFFIMIVLAITLGLIYFTTIVSRIKNDVNRDLEKYTISQNVRDAIYFCYGSVLKEEYLNAGSCRDGTKIDIPDEFIKAYQITRFKFGNCTYASWSNVNISAIAGHYKDRFVYAIPILQADGANTCPGKLEVFM